MFPDITINLGSTPWAFGWEALAAVGTVAATAVAVWLAWREGKVAKDERHLRKESEDRLAELTRADQANSIMVWFAPFFEKDSDSSEFLIVNSSNRPIADVGFYELFIEGLNHERPAHLPKLGGMSQRFVSEPLLLRDPEWSWPNKRQVWMNRLGDFDRPPQWANTPPRANMLLPGEIASVRVPIPSQDTLVDHHFKRVLSFKFTDSNGLHWTAFPINGKRYYKSEDVIEEVIALIASENNSRL